MRQRFRNFFVATIAASFVAAALPQAASAAFDATELKCRSTIAKSGGKYAKTVQKAITGCHKTRDKEGPNGLDCNSLGTADLKDKVPDAAVKFGTVVAGKCTAGTPGDVLYEDCPAPCAAAINTFTNLTDCLICLTNSNEEGWAEVAYGDPTAPMADDAEAACHKSITKNGAKLFNGVIKTVAKCQANFEKNGSETVSASCVDNPGFSLLTDEAYNKARASIADACAEVSLPSATLDPCGGEITVFDLSVCVVDAARNSAQELVAQYLSLDDDGASTTTTTEGPTTTTTDGPGTTTTTMPPADGACPDLGELVLFSKTTNIVCTNNADCAAPRFCNTTISRCETVAELDSGWNGAGHDSDINDQVKAMANLSCPGPAAPGCGECTVTGLSPEPGNCRCANSITTKCDEPFVADADDCGGAVCNCYFGAPFPLSSNGTPVCITNRFSADISGTANPDLGSGQIQASLRASVFLGYTTDMPCAVCGGKCSNDNSGCIFDEDCDGGATCTQDTPGDGVRDGQCIRDPNAHTSTGEPCDIDGQNASFPARLADPTPGQGGAGYSIDCQPNSPNAAGAGLKITLSQTTGLTSLSAGLDCNAGVAGNELCPCNICNVDFSEPCDSNADCAAIYKSCQNAPHDFGVACNTNTDCTSINLGPCTGGINRCRKNTNIGCMSNADCLAQPGGTCDTQTCSGKVGSAPYPQPDFCADDICTDEGGGEGTCAAGPNFLYCDGLVKADGAGINACLSNNDCGGNYGLCTIADQADCFLNPIVAVGNADPEFPVAGAVFCIPPTSNSGVNSAAGLPGPGRVISQGAARTFCASNHAVEYTPGGIPACP
jgi:hypothetical protein